MWPNPQDAADLVIFTEEIFNGKLHFLCSVKWLCFNKISRKDSDGHNVSKAANMNAILAELSHTLFCNV